MVRSPDTPVPTLPSSVSCSKMKLKQQQHTWGKCQNSWPNISILFLDEIASRSAVSVSEPQHMKLV